MVLLMTSEEHPTRLSLVMTCCKTGNTKGSGRTVSSLVRQRNHQALAHGLGIAHKGLHRGIGALPSFEL